MAILRIAAGHILACAAVWAMVGGAGGSSSGSKSAPLSDAPPLSSSNVLGLKWDAIASLHGEEMRSRLFPCHLLQQDNGLFEPMFVNC
jgi:hypothetical protein